MGSPAFTKLGNSSELSEVLQPLAAAGSELLCFATRMVEKAPHSHSRESITLSSAFLHRYIFSSCHTPLISSIVHLCLPGTNILRVVSLSSISLGSQYPELYVVTVIMVAGYHRAELNRSQQLLAPVLAG